MLINSLQRGEIPCVIGEARRLEQVFVNLLINAAQALPDGHADKHHIRLSTYLGDDGFAAIDIEDTGHGIAKEHLEKIFDPFYTTRPVGEGTGLGLSISYSLVSQFGGDISIKSEEGKGTCVTVKLLPAGGPVQASPMPTRTKHTPAAKASPPSRRRILVVDDEPGILGSLQRMLREHVVVGTTSGQEAVQLYSAAPFDLVLCDVMMPQFSGIQVYQALAALGPEHAERVTFITGGAFTPQAKQFLAKLPNRCLQKPLDESELRTLLPKTQSVDT